MDKFLQQFKHHLDNQPLPDFEPQDWADMKKRLDATEATPKRIGSYWAWLAAVLFLCSLGFNWFLYDKFQAIDHKITNLSTLKDSVVYTQVIYRTDTIHIAGNSTAFVEKGRSQVPSRSIHSSANPYNVAYQPSIFIDNRTPPVFLSSKNDMLWNNSTTKTERSILSNFWSYRANHPSILQQKQAAAEAKVLLTPSETLASIPMSKLISHESNLPNLPTPEIAEVKKSLQQQLYPLRPKAIAIGTNISVGTTPSNKNDLYILNRGLIGQVKFSDALRLSANASLSNFDYESSEMGDEFGIPVIAFPNGEYELEEIKVNRKIWSADIGMNYSFFTQKKWQPFIGIGFGTSSLTKNEINYVFEDEMIDEYFTEVRNYEKASHLPYTRLSTGIAYSIEKKWRVQLAIDYLYRLENFNNQIPENFNIGLAILYGF